MTAESFDVVVIGAGISGLVDAILLAETGRRVCVLEQHTIPGGFLQMFKRKGTAFDVGFHYMGSTEPGRPMRQFLDHLQIHDRLDLIPFPDDCAIEVRRGDQRFGYPSRFERFIEKVHEVWPGQGEELDRLIADVREVTGAFSWFDLRNDREYLDPLDHTFPRISLEEYLATRISDPWLREVLCHQTFNLGLFAAEIPWVKHMLAFRSNFDTTCRVRGGGGALVTALIERGAELGVEVRYKSEVNRLSCAGRLVERLHTSRGDTLQAEQFIAACHPKVIMRCLSDDDLRPVFKQRILDMKDSRGAVQIFLRLRRPLESLGKSSVMITDLEEARGEPALHTVLVSNPTILEGGPPRLEAMTYMDDAPFQQWKDRRTLRRGPDYEAFKAELAARMIRIIARQAPELPDLIEDVYSATPLTDHWYTLAEHGGVFGVSHDVSQQGTARPMPRMRLRNLFFTGHSIHMPGICGVFINAFDSCARLRGDDLFQSVARSSLS